MIINNELLLGAHGFAAELGLITVNIDGALDHTTLPGSLEGYAAGPAIARLAQARVREGCRCPKLRRTETPGGGSWPSETTFRRESASGIAVTLRHVGCEFGAVRMARGHAGAAVPACGGWRIVVQARLRAALEEGPRALQRGGGLRGRHAMRSGSSRSRILVALPAEGLDFPP